MRVFWGVIFGAILFGGASLGYSLYKDRESIDGRDIGTISAPDNFDDQAYFASLKESGPRAEAASTVDMDALIAALPNIAAVSYDEIITDGTDNATIIRGLTITGRDNVDVGVRIAQTRLWGFDSDGLAARLRGERLDDVIAVADRLEMSGISAFGLGTLYQPIVDASAKITMNIFENALPDGEIQQVMQDAGASVTIDSYAMGAEKIVITKLALHPYVLDLFDFPETAQTSENAPAFSVEQFAQSLENEDGSANNEFEFEIENDDSQEQVIHWIQTMAAWNHAVSFDAMAMYDSLYVMKTTDGFNQQSTMRIEIPLVGYKDYHRGDLAVASMRGLAYEMSMPVPVEPDAGEAFSTQSADNFVSLSFKGTIEKFLMRDLRLSNVYDLMARAVAPDKSMTDLLSLGLWTVENETLTMNDAPFYSMKKTVADLRGFHGIYPAKIAIAVDDAAYNFVEFTKMVGGITEGYSQNAEDQAAASKAIGDVVKILEDNDFVDPAMDLNLAWDWDPATGRFDGNGLFSLEDFISFTSKSDLDLPNYDALTDNLTFDMTEEQEAALGEAFEQMFAFKGAEMRLSDRGGVAKSFAMAVAFAEMMPASARTGFLVGAEPDDLRVMAATTMRLSAGQMAQAFPPAQDYILAAADFVSKGGTLIAKFDPEEPITAALIKAKEEDGTMDDPAAALKIFGFTLTHKGSGVNTK